MRTRLLIVAVLLAFPFITRADEGMWIPSKVKQLNIDTMHNLGFNLTADDLYSVTNPSLKDAVVIFGGGCTGEVVSDKGLIFTNHHCGYGAIQNLSSVEHDYLKDGFWATNNATELACENLKVKFLISFENVTDSIVPFLPDSLSEDSRKQVLDKLKEKLETRASQKSKYECNVRSFFGGNEYYLLVYQVFTDVRLVGTPPSSIGKFGYDTDNWMWPRHTGDFSVFRVYADSAGNPASYSTKNIPLKPKKFLPISLKGINQGDFSMTIGFPGTTNRFYSSYEVKDIMDITNTLRIKIRGLRQDILWKDMMADNKILIQYSAKYAGSSNYWKYSIGQNKGLNRLHVIERKQEQENEFRNWINTDAILKAKYENVLPSINQILKQCAPYSIARQYYSEGLYQNIELISLARQLIPLYDELLKSKPDNALVKKYCTDVKFYAASFFDNYSKSTDLKVASASLAMLSKDLKPEFKFNYLLKAEKKTNGNFEKFVSKMYNKTILSDQTKLDAFLNNPKLSKLQNDIAFMFCYDATLKNAEISKQLNSPKADYPKYQRKFIAGIREMNKSKVYSPDANFSMRISYGTIKSYKPADATEFDYFTSLKGVMEKEDSTNFEFIVPSKLKQLYKNRDFGIYSKNGDMPVCFTSNNDITGGNSGSPVINGNGQLIGIAFDGNWEAMSGDIIYEPELKRTISVDIRYVLFVIDKFAGAGYLLNELQIDK